MFLLRTNTRTSHAINEMYERARFILHIDTVGKLLAATRLAHSSVYWLGNGPGGVSQPVHNLLRSAAGAERYEKRVSQWYRTSRRDTPSWDATYGEVEHSGTPVNQAGEEDEAMAR
jgi:hypothetical protein